MAYFYDYIILYAKKNCNMFGSVKVYLFWNKGDTKLKEQL